MNDLLSPLLSNPKAREMVKAAKSNHQPKKPAVTFPLSTSHCSQTTCSSVCQPAPPQLRQSAQQPASAAVDIRNIVQKEEEEEEEGEREKIKGTSLNNPPVIEELDTSIANRERGEDDPTLDDSDVPPLI